LNTYLEFGIYDRSKINVTRPMTFNNQRYQNVACLFADHNFGILLPTQ